MRKPGVAGFVFRAKRAVVTLFAVFLWIGALLVYFLSDQALAYLSAPAMAWCVALVLISIFLFFYILDYSPTSLVVLFFISASVFLFGRYLSLLLGKQDIFTMSFFVSYTLDERESIELTFLMLAFIIAIFIGAVLYGRPGDNNYVARQSGGAPLYGSVATILTVLFAVGSFAYIFESFTIYQEALRSGYLALYQGQGETYAGGLPIGTLFTVLLGLAYAFGSKSDRRMVVLAVLISSMFLLLGGKRGGFVAGLLFLLWTYGQRRPLQWSSVALAMLFLFFMLVLLGSFSARDLALAKGLTWADILAEFLYSQGISLMVFDSSTNVSSYPAIAFIQSFVPGAARFLSIFFDLRTYDTGYSDYLSYTLNPTMYLDGAGMGWSLPGSFYVWSGGQPILMCLIAMFFGWILRALDCRVGGSAYYTGLCAALFSGIMLLPRGQFANVAPLVLYFTVGYMLIRSLSARGKR